MKNESKEQLSFRERNLIEQMLYGPYKPEWYRPYPDCKIANTDKEIADRLGIHINQVTTFTTELSNQKLKKVIEDNKAE